MKIALEVIGFLCLIGFLANILDLSSYNTREKQISEAWDLPYEPIEKKTNWPLALVFLAAAFCMFFVVKQL